MCRGKLPSAGVVGASLALYSQVYIAFENIYGSYRAARCAKRGRVEAVCFKALVGDERYMRINNLGQEWNAVRMAGRNTSG